MRKLVPTLSQNVAVSRSLAIVYTRAAHYFCLFLRVAGPPEHVLLSEIKRRKGRRNTLHCGTLFTSDAEPKGRCDAAKAPLSVRLVFFFSIVGLFDDFQEAEPSGERTRRC